MRLLAVLLCASCVAPVAEGESRAFTPEQQPYVDAAFAEWGTATGGSALVALQESGVIVERGKPPRGLGAYLPAEGRIVLNTDAIDPPPTLPSQELTSLTLHELGHVLLGAEHIPGTLMDQHVGDCIDERTLERFCEMRGCARMESTCP